MSATGVLVLPIQQIVGISGPVIGTGSLVLPVIKFPGAGSAQAVTAVGALKLPLQICKGGQATNNFSAAGSLVIPLPLLSGNSAATGALILPTIEIDGTGQITPRGTGVLEIPKLLLAGVGTTGSAGIGQLVIPIFQFVGAGYPVPEGFGAFTLPLFTFAGDAFNAVLYQTVVVNTRHFAVSEYVNFNFDSFCEFPEGNFLAAGPSGLMQLYSTTGLDNGSRIDAELQFGTADFEEANIKNCPDGYINFRGNGSVEVDALVDERQDPASGQESPDIYLIQGIADGRLRSYKFKMSRFRQGNNWRFSIKNYNGSSMDIDEVAVFYDVLSRRVGGH